MTRTVGASLKTHFGAETQTLASCFRLTLTHQQPKISNVTWAGSPEVVTVTTTYPHNRSTDDVVQIVDVVGITGLNYAHDTNDLYYKITVTDVDEFTFAGPGLSGSYTSGGEARVTYGITNIDQDITYVGATYHADTGGVPSALRTSVGMEVGSFDNTGVYAPANISENDILVGKVDFAEVEVFVVNYSDLTMGKMIIAFGYIGPLELQRNAYTAKFESLTSVLAQDTIRILSPDCPYDLGDSDCGLDVAGSPSFTFTGSALTVISKTSFADSSRTEADGYFDGGLLTWTTGPNAGLQVEVQTYIQSGGTFLLWEPMPNTFSGSPADQYSVVAGCSKDFDTCKTKFNNAVSFGGFNYLPGMVQISSVGGKN